jgi:phosphoribosylformylglycinamidine cyclo-ligase
VSLDAAEEVVKGIAGRVTSSWGDEVVGGFGGFAAGIRLPSGYERPVLMMSTDGVGTKLDIARRAGDYRGVGHDLVAMCVDDLAAVGARPLAFTDYLAVGRVDPEREKVIVGSIAEACRASGCALLGGETAEHPGVVDADHVDLAGAALGILEEGNEITGTGIAPGDVVIGVLSPNLRSNGYSLVRHIIGERPLTEPLPGTERTLGEVLLEPSVIYTPAVLAAVRSGGVRGLVHVTGGGIHGNLARVLPEQVDARIDVSWDVPPVFRVLQTWGRVSDEEMFRVFNMGIGYLAVAEPAAADPIITAFSSHGHRAQAIGRIESGAGAVVIV